MPFGTITSTSNTFGSISGDVGANVPGTLSGSVGVPGPQGPAGSPGSVGPQGPVGPAGQGVPAGGLTNQFLVKASNLDYATAWTTFSLAGYATESWVTSQGYLTSSALTGYATQSFVAANYAPIAAGQPTSGTVGQVLTKNSGSDWDSSWQTLVPGDRYLTTSTTSNTIGNGAKTFTVGTGLSYSSQQDVVISYDASNHMHAVVTSYNSGTGVLVVDVRSHTGSGTYTSWTVNVGGTTPLQTVEWGEILGTLGDQTDLANALNAKLETSTAASTYAALAGATFTGLVSTPASVTGSAGLRIVPGVGPTSPVNGDVWTTTTDLQVRLNGVTETVAEQSWVTAGFYPLTGNPSGFLTSASLSGYALLSGATFTGLVNTLASSTAGAGFRLPHGAAPTTPTDGDVWTTTGNLWVRINGASQAVALQGSSAQLSSNNIFTNASSTYGNSTAAGTINLGTGATISGSTRTINIGTASAVGSINAINIGGGSGTITTTVAGTLTATGTTLNLGNSTAASTINLGTGATLTATTKAVNIGTNGVAGSTTNIVVGSTTGTSTTTLQGTTNGVTVAADTNSTALATTAFVVGQAGSATPLVDGTAAVGTSLRYARQDHVHPTDTSRAALASPTFTGTPAAPTAAVDTNTTQLATTAFVVAQAGSATPLVDGTAAVGTSLRYARQDHVHPTDTTRAPLASPAFTGTPSLPTGTTAVTQSAGNNTTAVATTAFVTAAVPAFATETQAIYGTSSTTTISPLLMRYIMSNGGYTAYTALLGNYSSYVSGSGSIPTVFSNFVQVAITAANGKAAFLPNNNVSYHSFSGRGVGELTIDWTKPVWFSFRFNYSNTGQIGDANTINRVTIGKVSSTFGDLSSRGIGVRWTAGTAGAFTVMGHNGTTLSTSASAVTVSNTTYFPTTNAAADFLVYSDGAGNVTLFCNNVQVATTTGGPSSGTSAGVRFTFETDNTTSTSGTVTCDYSGIRTMLTY